MHHLKCAIHWSYTIHRLCTTISAMLEHFIIETAVSSSSCKKLRSQHSLLKTSKQAGQTKITTLLRSVREGKHGKNY